MPFNGQQKPEPMTPEAVKESQDQLDMQNELIDYKAKGDIAEYIGKEDVDGVVDSADLRQSRALDAVERPPAVAGQRREQRRLLLACIGKRGYTGFVEQTSVVRHHHSPVDTLQHRRVGPRVVKVYYAAPIRCYYHWRNSIYFWMYRYSGENRARLRLAHFYMLLKSAIKVALFIPERGPVLRACARGIWDGLHARLERRF